MERRGKGKHPPPPLPPPRRAPREDRRQTSSGSFSASLLDAIYRSLDEGDGTDAPRRRSEEIKATATATATATEQFWWATEAGKPRQDVAGADRRRREQTGVARPRHSGGYASSTTSSSDSSSSSCSNGFSCSSASTADTDSTTVRRRHGPAPPPRVSEESSVVVAADATAQPKGKRKSKSRPCFPGARFRQRSPSQSSSPRPQPPSPATFACVLKALFTSARKPKTPAVVAPHPPPPISPDPPQTQTQRQTQTPAISAASAVKAAVVPEPSSVRLLRPDNADASVVLRRRVEELVRSLNELEEDDEGSDSSSDLFELESLRGAGADELPVYGTTSLTANRAIACPQGSLLKAPGK